MICVRWKMHPFLKKMSHLHNREIWWPDTKGYKANPCTWRQYPSMMQIGHLLGSEASLMVRWSSPRRKRGVVVPPGGSLKHFRSIPEGLALTTPSHNHAKLYQKYHLWEEKPWILIYLNLRASFKGGQEFLLHILRPFSWRRCLRVLVGST